MKYETKLEKVAVLGAAGKMGSGILLLTAMEMMRLKLELANKDREFVLYAMDTSHKALSDLMVYIRSQVLKKAEKNIVALRKAYANRKDLTDNEEIINQYTVDVCGLIRPVTLLEPVFESTIVFEAVSENPELKVQLLSEIQKNSKHQPWFFSNTSAIPIAWLDEQAQLEGNIMGVHFYNPPAVQKLLEVVKTESTRPELSYFVADFVKNIRKISVPAYDVAGFIGNGYFMRDFLFAEQLVNEMQQQMGFIQAIYMVNKISQDFLIRPMGIFQLADYVGLDVVRFIMSVMKPHINKEKIHSPLIDQFFERHILGGQNADGSQKNGFFSYEKGKITGIYDPGKKRYIALGEFSKECDDYLGELPASWLPWKQMMSHPEKDTLLRIYFNELKSLNGPARDFALRYLQRFREIGMGLVKDKVAFRFDDVNAVLTRGFHNAYGPVNDYF